jgi:coenzyme PQQ precursor peptide PqqA
LRRSRQSHENHEGRFNDFLLDQGSAARENSPRTLRHRLLSRTWRKHVMWTKPEFTEMRFGFEVTMYIYNR